MSYSNKVVFTFCRSFEAKAAAAIPGLPLVLQGYYGLKVWTWFTEDIKAEMEAYEWDPNQGLIEKPTEIDINKDYINLDGWEDLDNNDQQMATTTNPTTDHGFKITPTLGKNQYQDGNTIKRKHFALKPDNSTQDSTTTTNSNNPSSFTLEPQIPSHASQRSPNGRTTSSNPQPTRSTPTNT